MTRIRRTGERILVAHNIYERLTTTTPVTLINNDTVGHREIGHGSDNLIINTVNIANTADDACTIDLYLKRKDEVDRGPTETFTYSDEIVAGRKKSGTYSVDASIYSETDNPAKTITSYYILKGVIIPAGSSLRLDSDSFKDINFNYYDLAIVGDSNSNADIIINFKKTN